MMVKVAEFKKKNKLNKETVNVIRTTQRNNVELTHIADNKANVLLSLNAVMLTFLIPNVVSHTEFILENHLFVPLIILACTCFATIFISTLVLKPSSFSRPRYFNGEYRNHSPFFFGNIYKMSPEDFFNKMDGALADWESIRLSLAQDMYYAGKRLAYKMNWIRRAFNIFLIGLFLSLVATGVVIWM